MQDNDEMTRFEQRHMRFRVNSSGLLDKVLTFATGAVLLVAGLMLSLVVFTLAAIAAGLILGFLWWKTRDQRRQLRERRSGGRVIDGEVIREPRKG